MYMLLHEVNAIVDNIAFSDEVLRAIALSVTDVESDVGGNWRRAVPKEVRCRYVLMLCSAHLMYSDVASGITTNIDADTRNRAEQMELEYFEWVQSYESYTKVIETKVIIMRTRERSRVVRDRFKRDARIEISEWNAPQWVRDLPPYLPLGNSTLINHELRNRMYRLMRWELSVLNDVQEGITIDDVKVLEQSTFRSVTARASRQHSFEDIYLCILAYEVVESSGRKLQRLGRPLKALAQEKVWSMMPTSTKIRVIEQNAYNDLARSLAMDSVVEGFNTFSISAKRKQYV